MRGYAIVETKENGRNCATAVPKLWIRNKVLYWPGTSIVDRQNPVEPQWDVWKQFSIVILKDNIGLLC